MSRYETTSRTESGAQGLVDSWSTQDAGMPSAFTGGVRSSIPIPYTTHRDSPSMRRGSFFLPFPLGRARPRRMSALPHFRRSLGFQAPVQNEVWRPLDLLLRMPHPSSWLIPLQRSQSIQQSPTIMSRASSVLSSSVDSLHVESVGAPRNFRCGVTGYG